MGEDLRSPNARGNGRLSSQSSERALQRAQHTRIPHLYPLAIPELTSFPHLVSYDSHNREIVSWLPLEEAHTGVLYREMSGVLISLEFSYSLTVFSPSGKLVQIEHALAAVASGTTSLGIKGTSCLHVFLTIADNVKRPMESSLPLKRSPHLFSLMTLSLRK